MKAITIHQPWATLIALGEKQFETRSWPTKYRGPLAIHAGKQIDKDVCLNPVISKALRKHGILFVDDLPTGAIVATCRLAECWKWDADDRVLQRTKPIIEYDVIGKVANHIKISDREKAFGWYDDGRYAWELTDVKQLPEPIPAKGQQGLWNWEADNHERISIVHNRWSTGN